MKHRTVSLPDLIRSPKFRRFYQLMCELADIKLTLSEWCGEQEKLFLLDYEWGQAPLCHYLRHHPVFCSRCKSCDLENFNLAVKERRGRSYLCHAGLVDMAAPLFIAGNLVGGFCGGQLLPAPPDKKNFATFWRYVAEFEFDHEETRKLYWATPWISIQRQETLLQLLTMFVEYFYEIGPRLLDEECNSSPIATAKHYIDTHWRDPLTLDDIAEEVGLTSAYLSVLFKQETGENYIDYLRRLRVEEAKKILRKRKSDIIGIAFDAGFGSLSSFNRAFRRETGTNPANWRRQHYS